MDGAVAGLLGTILGFGLKATYDYFRYKSEREDRYYFAMLQKRFEVYQQANHECEKLKGIVYDTTEKKTEIIKYAREWFHQNNLYLSPDLRNDFLKLTYDTDFYGEDSKDFKVTSKETGTHSDETNLKRIELLGKWENIQGGTKKIIQDDIDRYYKKLNN